MSEVRQYYADINDPDESGHEDPDFQYVVLATDFDTLSAERDRLQAELDQMRAHITTDNSQTLVNALAEIERLHAECERLASINGAAQRVTCAVIEERDQLRAELESLRAGSEVVVWQFYQGGKWWNGDDRINSHRANTVAAGIPVRDIYSQSKPPANVQGLWRRRDGVFGCKRFMSDECYQAQSDAMKANYAPNNDQNAQGLVDALEEIRSTAISNSYSKLQAFGMRSLAAEALAKFKGQP